MTIRRVRPKVILANTAFQMTLVHLIVVYCFTSARTAVAELADPQQWDAIGVFLGRLYPERPDLWTGPPPNRSRYMYFRDRYLSSDDGLVVFREVLEQGGVYLATNTLGLCDPFGPGSLTHPDSTRRGTGDGTVIRPPSKYKPGTPVYDDEKSAFLRFRRADDGCRP